MYYKYKTAITKETLARDVSGIYANHGYVLTQVLCLSLAHEIKNEKLL